ncbi:MAG: hypothetical protein ACPF8V_10790, partial [Luteibaculum sp.]
SGEHILGLSNLGLLLDQFCVSLLDSETGIKTPIMGDMKIPVEISEAGNLRYHLVLEQNLSVEVEINKPKCAGEAGNLLVKADARFWSEQYGLYKEGILKQEFALSDSTLKYIQVLAGEYTLTNLDGFAQCGSADIKLSVPEGEYVNANIIPANGTQFTMGEEAIFYPEQDGNDVYEWTLLDSSWISPEAVIQAAESGNFQLFLSTKKGECIKKDSLYFSVAEPNGIDNSYMLPEGVQIENGNIKNLESIESIRIFALDGKLIKSFQQAQQIPLYHETFIYCFDQTCITLSCPTCP